MLPWQCSLQLLVSMRTRIAAFDLSLPAAQGYRFFLAACDGICNVSDRLLSVSKFFVDGLPHTSNHLKCSAPAHPGVTR